MSVTFSPSVSNAGMNLVVIMPVLLIRSVNNTAGMNLVVCMTVSCLLSMIYTTKDILSTNDTYTNGDTLPRSQLEHGGALAPLKF